MSRVAIVTELYWPSVGGQEVRYRELARQLIAAGHTVEVLTIASELDTPPVELFESVTVRRLIRSCSYRRPSRRMPRNPLTIVAFSLLVLHHLIRHTQDYVIFSQWPLLPQLLCGRICTGVNVVDWCEHRSGILYKLMFALVAKSTKKHISVSSALRGILIQKYGIRSIVTIPSGIERAMYGSCASKEGVLFLGRLVAHKHPELVLAAVKVADQLGHRFNLTIAGDGPLRDSIENQARELPYVQVVGAIGDVQKRKLFQMAWLYVLPSEREGFPRTIAEAMACGTPTLTVSSPDNGGKDVVAAFNCGIVSEPTPESLAEALIRLVRDRSRWEELSESGLRASDSLDWRHVTQTLMQFVEA
jgi:glycosyltransferase involved in cell wall biosynthesis